MANKTNAKLTRTILTILLLLNFLVLLGQLWPEGAPPFANAVNLLFLIANLIFLVFSQFSIGRTIGDNQEQPPSRGSGNG